MASTFTTPATYAVGDVYTAATVNLYVRDNTTWLGTDKPNVRVFSNATTQSSANGVPYTVRFDQERFDNRGLHSSTSSTSKLIIPSGCAGQYLFGYTLTINAVGTSANAFVGLNGASNIVRDSIGGSGYGTATGYYRLNAADYIELGFVQNSGGTASIVVEAQNSPEFWAVWMNTAL